MFQVSPAATLGSHRQRQILSVHAGETQSGLGDSLSTCCCTVIMSKKVEKSLCIYFLGEKSFKLCFEVENRVDVDKHCIFSTCLSL